MTTSPDPKDPVVVVVYVPVEDDDLIDVESEYEIVFEPDWNVDETVH